MFKIHEIFSGSRRWSFLCCPTETVRGAPVTNMEEADWSDLYRATVAVRGGRKQCTQDGCSEYVLWGVPFNTDPNTVINPAVLHAYCLDHCYRHNICRYCGAGTGWKSLLCNDCDPHGHPDRAKCAVENCPYHVCRLWLDKDATRCGQHNTCSFCGNKTTYKEAQCMNCGYLSKAK